MLLGLQCSVQLCPLGFFCVLGEVKPCCVGGQPLVLAPTLDLLAGIAVSGDAEGW